MKSAVAVLSIAALLPCVPALYGQSLDERISRVHDGTVQLHFTGRPGVCGDGSDIVRSGRTTYTFPSSVSYGRDDFVACRAGPVRVSIGRAGGETVSLRVRVGAAWAAASAGDVVSDLGTVPAAEAARYFLRQAPLLGGRNGDYALAAAAIADSVVIWPDLVRLVRSTDVRSSLRQRAVFWLADADDGAPEAHRALRDLIKDQGLPDDVRSAAIIALPRDDITVEDATLLEVLYPSLPSKLKNSVFLALSRSDDRSVGHWFESIIVNEAESVEERKQALFWAGQGQMPIAQLAALYGRVSDPDLKRHFTFVLSQRHDPAAIDRLIDIAQHDPDREVRKQAFFWLGQSRESRARDFLRDVVTR